MQQTLGPPLLATAFTLVGLSTIVVALRLYCRRVLVGQLRSYDFVMLSALLTTWGIATINYYQVKYGTGVHLADMDMSAGPAALTGTLKSWYAYQLLYLVDLCLVKFSILLFYLVLSPQTSFRAASYVTMSAVATFTIAMAFVNAFECPHPSDAWSVELLLQGAGSCRNLRPIYFGQAGFNIGSDIIILCLPMPMLASLRMLKQKRIALIGIFSVGSIAVIASIVRIYALYKWDHSTDMPYDGAYILIWSEVEINIAIIAASVPFLKPLFGRSFESTTQGTLNSFGYNHYSTGTPMSTSARKGDIPLRSINSGSRSQAVYGASDSDEQILCHPPDGSMSSSTMMYHNKVEEVETGQIREPRSLRSLEPRR